MLTSVQVDDEALTSQDPMGMTSLHVLCSTPSATPDMIKEFVLKNHDVL